jgi:hypothetical protein
MRTKMHFVYTHTSTQSTYIPDTGGRPAAEAGGIGTVCMYVYTYVCMHVFLYMFFFYDVCIYIYTHTYIYTCTYVYN